MNNSCEINRFFIQWPAMKILLFGGKGGVGKTTLASATALTVSDLFPQKRILLFSADPAHSLSDCLDIVVGSCGLFLKTNLFVREMDAEKEYDTLKHLFSEEVREFADAFIKRDTGVQVVFEKEILEALIDMTPPGIDEVMALTTIIDYLEKENFDILILDTAPTGHLIRFLEMPELTLEWLKLFFNLFLKYKNVFHTPKLSTLLVDLSKKIKKLLTILRDEESSLFIPIAIPTEMAYEETRDLVEVLKKLKIPVNQLVLNMVHPVPQKNASANECALCMNRTVYEEKMLTVFTNLFPKESLCIIHRQVDEMIGINALQRLGRKIIYELF